MALLSNGCGLALDLDPPDPPPIVDGGTDMPVPECFNDGECSDGLFCNGVETCTGGSCQASAPVSCAPDATDCTVERCEESLDDCVSEPNDALCVDPLVCMPGAGCIQPRVCDDAMDCDDGNHCNGIETCSTSGQCVAGTGVTCTSVGCRTNGRCIPSSGACEFDFDDDQCDDDDACNGVEACDPSGTCTNPPDVSCPNAGQCGVGVCSPSSGACGLQFDDGLCDDGWACTNDQCDTGTCLHQTDNSLCDDGHGCTVDRCVVGPTDPPDPPFLDAAGCVHVPDDLACQNRDSECFVGVCAPDATTHDSNGCAIRVNTTACDNGTRCGDNGQCEPLPIIISCTVNTCDDGNPCNGVETCSTLNLLCGRGAGGCPISSDPCAQPFCDFTNGTTPVCATRPTAACFTAVGTTP